MRWWCVCVCWGGGGGVAMFLVHGLKGVCGGGGDLINPL